MNISKDEEVDSEGYGGMDPVMYEAIVTFKKTALYPPFCDLKKNRNACVNWRKKCAQFMATDNDTLLYVGNGEHARVVVRRGDTRTAIKVIHERHNHSGQKFTICALNRRLYWRSVRRDVSKFINEDCEYCARARIVRGTGNGVFGAFMDTETKRILTCSMTEEEESTSEKLLLNCTESQMEQLDHIIKEVKASQSKEEIYTYVGEEYVLEDDVFIDPISENNYDGDTLPEELAIDGGRDRIVKVEPVFEESDASSTSNQASISGTDDLTVASSDLMVSKVARSNGIIASVPPLKSRKRPHKANKDGAKRRQKHNEHGLRNDSVFMAKEDRTKIFESEDTCLPVLPGSSFDRYETYVEREVIVGQSGEHGADMCDTQTHEQYEIIETEGDSQNVQNDHSLYHPISSQQDGRECEDEGAHMNETQRDNVGAGTSFSGNVAVIMPSFDPEVVELQKRVLKLQQEVLLMQRDYMRQKLTNLSTRHYMDEANLEQQISQMEGPDIAGTVEIIEESSE